MRVVAAVARSNLVATLAAAPLALVYGALIHKQPALALSLVAVAAVAGLAIFFRTATLVLLLFFTVIVPYGLQNQAGIGGGGGSPGLLPSDALMLAALVVTVLVMLRDPPDVRIRPALVLAALFIAIATVQFVRGIVLGRAPSEVGVEYRILLSFSTIFLAVPVLEDPRSRRRFLQALLGLGLLLGLWGLAQWVVNIPFSLAGDAGVREGVRLTSAGRGQIQGGLFIFPVATIMSLAVLVSGAVRSGLARILLIATFALNGISLVLTYERTFWVATVFAVGVIVLKAGGAQRLRALVVAPMAAALVFVALGSLAPDTLTAARERLLSLGQYGSDNSVRYRLAESRHVIEEIAARPFTGSGLAATIHWGRPWEGVRATSRVYSHNGYLWLTWKVGLIGAALLLALVLWGALARGSPASDPLVKAVRDGAQAALLAMLLVSITFPAFNSLSAAPTIGLLLAMAFLFRERPAPRAAT